jgi:hypothetical protein
LPTLCNVPKRSTENAAAEATPGSRKPLVFSATTPGTERGRSQTAIEMSRMAAGHAVATNVFPRRVAPAVELKTLKVSPMTLSPIPVAMSAHGFFPLPDRRVVAATISASSRTSPIG